MQEHVYGRSLKDDTSYPDKMLHLPAEARRGIKNGHANNDTPVSIIYLIDYLVSSSGNLLPNVK